MGPKYRLLAWTIMFVIVGFWAVLHHILLKDPQLTVERDLQLIWTVADNYRTEHGIFPSLDTLETLVAGRIRTKLVQTASTRDTVGEPWSMKYWRCPDSYCWAQVTAYDGAGKQFDASNNFKEAQ